MERFWCYLVGLAIALVLVAGLLVIERILENREEAQKRRMTRIAEDVYNERSKVIAQYVRDLTVNLIDQRLAEKEGDHEDN